MTVLCYHEVHPDWQSPLAITPEAFERQCLWLAAHRDVVSLRRVARRLLQGRKLPRRTVVLTFDDGFTGLHEFALPILRRYQLPATVFLVARTVEQPGSPVDWVDTPPTWPLRTLSRDQIAEMQDAGVEFESHSYAHLDLTSLSPEELKEDLSKSRVLLSDLLDERVQFLAYPRGFHNAATRKAAATAGYAGAFSLPETREPAGAYAIPRVGVFPGNEGWSFAIKTYPLYLRVRTGPLYPWARLALARSRPPVHRAANPDP